MRDRAIGTGLAQPRDKSGVEKWYGRPIRSARSRCYVALADPLPGHEGANGIVRWHRTGPRSRLVEVVVARRPCCRCWNRLCHRPRHWSSGQRRRLGHRPAVEPARQPRSAAGDAALHRLPGRRHQCRLHQLGAAQRRLRACAGGAGPCRPAGQLPVSRLPYSSSSSPTRNGGIAAGLSSRALTPLSTPRRWPVPWATPTPPRPRGISTRRRAPSSPSTTRPSGRISVDVQRRLRRDQPRLHDAAEQRVLGPPGQHPGQLDDHREPDRDDG